MNSLEGKPREVRRAIIQDDKLALSEMGKKGGAISGSRRMQMKDFNTARRAEDAAAVIAEQAKLYQIKDGDVLPPDESIPLVTKRG